MHMLHQPCHYQNDSCTNTGQRCEPIVGEDVSRWTTSTKSHFEGKSRQQRGFDHSIARLVSLQAQRPSFFFFLGGGAVNWFMQDWRCWQLLLLIRLLYRIYDGKGTNGRWGQRKREKETESKTVRGGKERGREGEERGKETESKTARGETERGREGEERGKERQRQRDRE